MWWSLIGGALFMGLAGGGHCLAMCAAPCALITRVPSAAVQIVHGPLQLPHKMWQVGGRTLAFHAGRLTGYGVLGGVAALAMEQLAWFADRTSVLHPIWTLMHLAALAWGLMLMLQARQPQWVEKAGRAVWRCAQPLLRRTSGVAATGGLWALMPCGLLYSAVLMAALAGSPLLGVAVMVAFGAGSAAWMVLGPCLWHLVAGAKWGHFRERWGLRLAGAILLAVSIWALWMDLIVKPAQWCR